MVRRCNFDTTYTHDSLNFGPYVYLNGDVATERGIIGKFIAHTRYHDISIMGYAACMNQEALNDGYYQIVTIDRRLLTNIIHVFLVIQQNLCFGHHDVSVPCETQNFNE